MEEDMWDAVIRVHLAGTFACTHAAATAMKEAGNGGRIINTSSTSGLLGNFGQSNYGAAKAGIYGFTRVASLELERFQITVNAIAPVAKTRMTDDLPAFSQGALDHLTADHISPIIVFLASDAAKGITGKCFDVGGQHLGMFEVKRSRGADKPGTEPWTFDEIREKIDEIMAWG
jgi:NAD(P)-dependent dehydrogenase (short-subunit alcohol dehydrogenase family)